MGKINMNLLKGIEEQAKNIEKEKEKAEKKPLNNTEQKVLDLYNGGMMQKDIAETIDKDKTTVSKALKHIREEYPELIKKMVSENIIEKPLQTAQKPENGTELSQAEIFSPVKEKHENRQNTKPKRAVMGFKADPDKMKEWKLYAEATGKEISVMCTAAIDEYMENHPLSGKQKQFYDLKKGLNS